MNFLQLMRIVSVLVFLATPASAQLIISARGESELPQADLICKVKLGNIGSSLSLSPRGIDAASVGRVISILKGKYEKKEIHVAFLQYGEGFRDLGVLKPNQVYLMLLKGKTAPYQIISSIQAVEEEVELKHGTKLEDRLLAEFLAMSQADDKAMQIEAIGQLGILRDKRVSKQVTQAAQSKDDKLAYAGIIAQYQMGVAPNAKRTMQLFDERMMNVWYQRTGVPRKDSNDKYIRRHLGRHKLLDRGVPEFDYAMYVREGIKKDWVHKDDHTLYVFFGIPWKIQRKECLPELAKLLDHPDEKIQIWAVKWLVHTVENRQPKPSDDDDIPKWRTWWKEQGPAFMELPEKLVFDK